MAIKGIKFNGETIEIPTEYLKNVSIDGNTITFTKPDGSTMTYTGSLVDIDALMVSLDNNYLSFTNNEQTLTENQQALVRNKIGAGSGSFSGNYEDLANKPIIPSLTSQLTNDSGFITAEDVPKPDLSGYITTETFTEFQQDIQDMSLGFTNMVSGVRTELVNKDTELQGKIDAKANTSDLATVATTGSYNDLTDKPTAFSGDYNDLTNRPTIPTKTSQLTNDSGFSSINYDDDGNIVWYDPTKFESDVIVNGNIEAINGQIGWITTDGITVNTNTAIETNYWWINMGEPSFDIYNYSLSNPTMSIDEYGDATFYNIVNAAIFNAQSDRRLKENIKDYKCKKSILELPVKEFDYKKTGTHAIGCIAQDLQEICPEIVNTDKDGYLSIQESKLVYLLLQEVKQLKAEIDKLKEV